LQSAALTITQDFEQATPGWPKADHLCSDTVRKSWQSFTTVAKKGFPSTLTGQAGAWEMCHGCRIEGLHLPCGLKKKKEGSFLEIKAMFECTIKSGVKEM
jgi:hypothetical protein